MNIISRFYLLLFVLPFNADMHAESPDVWCVIFIHGTLGIRNNASISNAWRILYDKVAGSAYEHSVNLMRENAYLYCNQAMQDLGLVPITQTSPAGSRLSARFFDEQMQAWYAPGSITHYYTFGWSGLLSEELRQQSAERLLRELNKERARLSVLYPGKTIKTMIIGYSHGGTVALNLAAPVHDAHIAQEVDPIDVLILLGTPMVHALAELAHHEIFKKTYLLYSRGDRVQTLDFLSLKRFPRRRFLDMKKCRLPDNILQIELKMLGTRKNLGCQCGVYGRDPGHIELWFFGWNKASYRTTFPLHPLPCMVFIPYIIASAAWMSPYTQDIVLEMNPDRDHSYIRPRRRFKRTRIPSPGVNNITQMKAQAIQARPENFDRKLFNAQVQTAIAQSYGLIMRASPFVSRNKYTCFHDDSFWQSCD